MPSADFDSLSKNRNSSDRNRSVDNSAYSDAPVVASSNSGKSGTHHRNLNWGQQYHPPAREFRKRSNQGRFHSLSPETYHQEPVPRNCNFRFRGSPQAPAHPSHL